MIDRRTFLFAAACGLLAASRGRAAELLKRTGEAFGTHVDVSILHDPPEAQKALAAALDEIARVDAVASLYKPDSPIRRLNRDGRLDDAPEILIELIAASRAISESTDGAFDITVQPLWELHAEAKKQKRLPEPAAIAAARAKVDHRKVRVEGRSVRFDQPDMAITLNGIAQGFAADRAIAALRRHGVAHALVNSGEIAAIGDGPSGRGWVVGIQHPREKDQFIAAARLSGQGMATSGDYATAFTDDRADHHIFNPATGRSPAELCSVTVIAPSAATADALATAFLVLGHDKSVQALRGFPGVHALFIDKDLTMRATRGFPLAE